MSFLTAEWLRLNTETHVYMRVGNYPSNTYVGSSRAYGALYIEVALPPGTPVADLAGGHFAFINERWEEVALELSEKHMFEKTYGAPRRPTWDGEPADVPEFTGRVDLPTADAAWVYANGKAYGRSDTYIVTERP